MQCDCSVPALDVRKRATEQSPMRHHIVGAFVTAVAVDLGTKWLILEVVMLPPRVIDVLPFFNLVLSFNTGISFGLFSDFLQDRFLVLVVIKSLVVLGLLIWASRSTRPLDVLGLSIIAGGATGNIVDRGWNGAVTDFLDFHWGGWHFWTFNMGDVAVTLGVCCVLLESIFPQRPNRTTVRHEAERVTDL